MVAIDIGVCSAHFKPVGVIIFQTFFPVLLHLQFSGVLTTEQDEQEEIRGRKRDRVRDGLVEQASDQKNQNSRSESKRDDSDNG